MRHLPLACLAPHGWLTIPLISGAEAEAAETTRASLEEQGRRFAAVQPETIVVVTPHGVMVDGCVSLLNTPAVRGDTAGMPWARNSRHSFALEFEVDRELNAALLEEARDRDVPAARVINHGDWVPLPIDFGALIPLYYLAATLLPRPKVVLACPDRGESSLPFEVSYRLGQSIRPAAERLGRRVALLCSGDLGHAHDPDGPYGLDPASARFDGAVVDALRGGDPERLRALDPELVRAAKTDAYGPLLTLAGACADADLHARLLSYEVPAYFGMACALCE